MLSEALEQTKIEVARLREETKNMNELNDNVEERKKEALRFDEETEQLKDTLRQTEQEVARLNEQAMHAEGLKECLDQAKTELTEEKTKTTDVLAKEREENERLVNEAKAREDQLRLGLQQSEQDLLHRQETERHWDKKPSLTRKLSR